MNSIDQKRAQHAYHVVCDVKKDAKGRDDFKRAVQDAPARAIASGFLQTIVFLKAKGRAPVLLEALADWLTRRDHQWPAPAGQKVEVDPWFRNLVGLKSVVVRLTTAEALAYIGWLKRFAEAEIPKKPKVSEG